MVVMVFFNFDVFRQVSQGETLLIPSLFKHRPPTVFFDCEQTHYIDPSSTMSLKTNFIPAGVHLDFELNLTSNYRSTWRQEEPKREG